MMQMMGMNYGNKDGRKETFECSDHPTWREAARMGGFQTSMILNRTSGDDPPSFAGDDLILMFSTVSVFSTKPAARVLQGFSGCLIVEHLDALVQGVLKPFTWALAGRSLPKLEKMASQCRSRPKVGRWMIVRCWEMRCPMNPKLGSGRWMKKGPNGWG